MGLRGSNNQRKCKNCPRPVYVDDGLFHERCCGGCDGLGHYKECDVRNPSKSCKKCEHSFYGKGDHCCLACPSSAGEAHDTYCSVTFKCRFIAFTKNTSYVNDGNDGRKWICFDIMSPCKFIVDNVEYDSIIRYLFASKAKLFNDPEMIEQISNTSVNISMIVVVYDHCNPEHVKNTYDIKSERTKIWRASAEKIIYKGILARILADQFAQKELLSTQDFPLVYVTSGSFYGVSHNNSDIFSLQFDQLNGENLIGVALMRAREVLRDL